MAIDLPQESGLLVSESDGTSRPAKLGEIVTSERGRALLFCWHLERPDLVCDKEQPPLDTKARPARTLLALFAGARKKYGAYPANWSAEAEQELIAALRDLTAKPENGDARPHAALRKPTIALVGEGEITEETGAGSTRTRTTRTPR